MKTQRLFFKNPVILDANGKRKSPSLLWDGVLIEAKERKTDSTQVLEDITLFPGVWDLHVHGGGGHSFSAADESEIRKALESQYYQGTSALMATLPALSPGATYNCLEALAQVMKDQKSGEAKLLGVYLEGPFINPEKAGGMNLEGLDNWSVNSFLDLLEKHHNLVKIVTVAPERPEAKELIPILVQRGITVSMGHTSAEEEEASRAVEMGTSLATHLFNAMGAFHHRAPGAALVCLLDQRVTVEFIPETAHLHPLVQKFIVKLKGEEGTIPVSDGTSLSAGGPEKAIWMNTKIYKSGKATRRKDGKLFGSAITLLEGLKLLHEECILPIDRAVPSLLRNTSRLLNVKAPSITTNYRGPLYYLSPKDGLKVLN